MKKKKKVTIVEHEWLDLSVSYFLAIDGSRQEGEFTSRDKVEQAGYHLAESIDGEFVNEVKKTEELFS